MLMLAHLNIRILHPGSMVQYEGIPDMICCRILESLKAKHMLPIVWTHQDEMQKLEPQYKETISINYQRYFGTEVKAYIPKDMQSIKILHTLGDGNCLWRAIARYTPHKWYTLKRRTLKHMKQKALAQKDRDLVTRIATLAKTNAWGNQEAIMGICSYLDVNICVTTGSAVLHFGCAAGSVTTFFVHLHDQHYSTVRRSDGERMYKHCCHGQCITLEDCHDLNVWSPEMIRSTRTYGDKVCSRGSFAKRCNGKNFTTCKARAMAPNCRPAGPNVGPPKRGPTETVADQFRRVALAKAAQPIQGGCVSGPKEPPGRPPKRASVPKEPPGPPPKRANAPVTPIPPPVPAEDESPSIEGPEFWP